MNEDEPALTERRRALMHSFTAEELVHHEPMVRRLAREYVDRFINKGEADLVDEMLWEVPLTVALHFLGVPESDMDTRSAIGGTPLNQGFRMIGYGDMVFRTLFGRSRARFSMTARALSENKCFPHSHRQGQA